MSNINVMHCYYTGTHLRHPRACIAIIILERTFLDLQVPLCRSG